MERPFQKKNDLHFSKNAEEALEQMMDLYGQIVLRTAFFYVQDRFLAEDICQETFIRAYRNWNKFQGNSSVKTWLIRITINLCKDKLGLKAFKSEETTDPTALKTSNYHTVEEEVMNRLHKTEILKHLVSLSKPHQEVLYLYYYLDFSTVEISIASSLPEGTIRARLHRARGQLKKLLQKEGFDQ
ncbi:sigma-70 family RNA polymerase sigma factor [Bacillus carboniphilus]|uniref:Sigma-70 family RNA polymerase sigma factor n=1 Tax=Bacillus carboniphilus TaxID=86663 RepID=A0ABN0WA94_9BACI